MPLKGCLEADKKRQLKFQLTQGDDESSRGQIFVLCCIAQNNSALESTSVGNLKVASN